MMLRIFGKLHSKNLQWRIGHVFDFKSVRYQSSKSSKSSGIPATALLTFGTVTLATGATLAYAKYDPNFRETLVKTVPYSNDIIKFVFQEDSSVSIDSISENIKSKIFGDDSSSSSKTSSVKPKRPEPVQQEKVVEKKTKAPLKTKIEKEEVKKAEEIKVEAPPKDKPTNVSVNETKQPTSVTETKKPIDKLPEVPLTADLIELERQATKASNDAVFAFNKAIDNLKKYNNEIGRIIDDNINQLKPEQLDIIRTKTRIKNESIEDVKQKTDIAIDNINKLKDLLTKPGLTEQIKEKIRNDLQKLQNNLNEKQQQYEREKNLSNITDKYWDKVEKARQHFINELQILFPTVNLNDKHLKLAEDQLDLFLLHAYSNILFYQKELAKLETIEHQKLQEAIAAAKANLDNNLGSEILMNAQIFEAVEKEKRQLAQSFQLKCLELKKEAEIKLREQLKLQSQCFTDHLDEEIHTKAMEIEQELSKKFDEQLDNERIRYKMQLAALIGRIKGLDESLKARVEFDEQAKQSQILWSACQALLRALKAGSPDKSWKDELRPLGAEIDAVEKAAAPTDELVKVVINGIPNEAKTRGVYPEHALRERFIKVEELARRFALIPENGGSLTLYLLSYLQSILLIKYPSSIPITELNDEITDFTDLTTNEVLERARYWLDRGDFTQTLKYMNLLKGASRSIAEQWMDETRIMLETQQAADTLMAHAASSGYTTL